MEKAKTTEILGDFELVREIGRGGMGIVYEARQRSLNRRVALKVLSSGLGLTAKAVVRFRREAEAAAKLHHTNIVPIYATGEDRGIHYYAMEFLDGPSLDQVIRQMRDARCTTLPQNSLDAAGNYSNSDQLPGWVSETLAYEKPSSENTPSTTDPSGSHPTKSGSGVSSGPRYFDTVASMIADVADALEYAHNQGVIHRDIKPSNLLLSPEGRLSVNDFGLARMLEQPGMTISGELVGSPLYMSPEQITAGRAPLDHRTDIYSLGATLYELLTLQPPYTGRLRDQIIAQIMHKEVVPPRRKNWRIPVDLETICLKSMDRDPDRRYQTAGQMAADLRRFVNRFAISARRVGVVARTVKWVRRKPAVSILLVLLVLAAGLAGLFFNAAYRGRLERIERMKEDTLLAAMSGEFAKASELMDGARELGAEHGWLQLMGGQIDALQGEYRDARIKLEQACILLPDSTAAYAMLSLAYLWDGDEDNYFRRLSGLEDLPAHRFEDYLLKGWAEATWLPQRAKANLKVARDLRPTSHVAVLLSAQALRRNALELPNPHQGLDEARQAMSMLQSLRMYLPDHPLVLSESVLSHVVAEDRQREIGHREEVSDSANQIREDLRRLDNWPDCIDAMWARTLYLLQSGRDDEILAEYQRAVDDGRRINNYIAVLCASIFYRKSDFSQALATCESTDAAFDRVGAFTRAYVELDKIKSEADRATMIKRYVEEMDTRQSQSSGIYQDFHWTVLRLLGEEEATVRVASQFRKTLDNMPGQEPFIGVADFMRGVMSSEDAIKASGVQRSSLSAAHFIIGIDCVARGDREAAKRHFQVVIDTNCRHLYYHWWSRAFLERLKSDPNWLPWFPPKVGHAAIDRQSTKDRDKID